MEQKVAKDTNFLIKKMEKLCIEQPKNVSKEEQASRRVWARISVKTPPEDSNTLSSSSSKIRPQKSLKNKLQNPEKAQILSKLKKIPPIVHINLIDRFSSLSLKPSIKPASKESDKSHPKDLEQLEYRNEKDKDFIIYQAPKILKKMLFKKKNWVQYKDEDFQKTPYYRHIEHYSKLGNGCPTNDENTVTELYNKFMKKSAFKVSFPTEYDKNWLKRCLSKKISDHDRRGYVYVYYRYEDQKKKTNDKVMAFKIGRSVDAPTRIKTSSRKNGETYTTAITEVTNYYKHFETIIHDYLEEGRIIRNEIKDGKTEWFYLKFSKIQKAMKKCRVYLKTCRNDKPS
ncbi:unnamed protein product [Moneuplotes crassus]|uniref:Bacteriophage T5 Orf172 DNA-binding domain-containing protein n=1 Tax=Euplotes crassus TaxID=5936 RepID=A0AAD1XLP8_EUPCR|nr:unnamed protein product [Moneuplotes crassus]